MNPAGQGTGPRGQGSFLRIKSGDSGTSTTWSADLGNQSVTFNHEFRKSANPNFFVFANPGQYSLNYNGGHGQNAGVQGEKHQGSSSSRAKKEHASALRPFAPMAPMTPIRPLAPIGTLSAGHRQKPVSIWGDRKQRRVTTELSPISEADRSMQDSHRAMQDSHRAMQESIRAMQEANRSMQEAERSMAMANR